MTWFNLQFIRRQGLLLDFILIPPKSWPIPWTNFCPADAFSELPAAFGRRPGIGFCCSCAGRSSSPYAQISLWISENLNPAWESKIWRPKYPDFAEDRRFRRETGGKWSLTNTSRLIRCWLSAVAEDIKVSPAVLLFFLLLVRAALISVVVPVMCRFLGWIGLVCLRLEFGRATS